MWVNFKVFGIMPLTIVFSLLQMPMIARHGPGDKEDAAD
jgi:intracellular septation protein